MSLSVGTRLGPYQVLAPLGAGGMGEVYRARDPRMGREVAIKVSAERFTDRFEREVHAVAALNHTNICQVYDVGPNYLVMELIEGPTLADRIASGAVPLEEVLAIARQIGDALEAAHEKGIIHRDLKPANIKIKPDGVVKVLDFGLAKIAEQAAAAGSPQESPTVTMGATVAGQVMGTAAYMAPEQARGKTVDKRADIWAFGVILYEMLTGRRLFEGETISDTLARVLTKEPEWKRVPLKAQRLLRQCLEKEPKRRLRDIGDASPLLDDSAPPAARNRLPWAIAVALAIGLALSFWAPWRTTIRPTEQSSTRLDLDLGSEISFAFGVGPSVILSPDGTRLVFVSKTQDGMSRLFTRRLDQRDAVPLQMTEGAYAPFFSSDGQWVGFFARGKLRKIRIDGGELVSLCDAPNGRGASWSEDGNIIASLDTQAGLFQVPPEGGKAVPLTKLNLEAGETTHRWPQVLPGGKDVLFMVSTTYGYYDDAGIEIVSLRDHRTKTLIDHAGMYPRYLPSGHLTYIKKESLFAVPFDPDRLEVRGAATFIEGVSTGIFGSAQIDFSRQGNVAYLTGRTEGLSTIQWLDATGNVVSPGFDSGAFLFARLSPDGHRAAVVDNQRSGPDLWIYDLERRSKNKLTTGIVPAFPAWSPDGRFVVFHAPGGLFSLLADGTGKPQPLTQHRVQIPATFTPNGAHLLFSELTPTGGAEFRIAPVESGPRELKLGESQLFLSSPTQNTFAAFSPDGRWLAYASAETGVFEVHVTSFPDKRIHLQVSNAGGTMPVWSGNGRELFYRAIDQRIMVVSYKATGDSFVAELPRLWSGKQLKDTGIGTTYSLAPDGKRFLVLMPTESTGTRERQSHVMLVLNFFDEVRRRLAGQAK